MNDSHDPLIQGPTKESAEKIDSHGPLRERINVQEATPAHDFLNLLRKPAAFFQSIPAQPSDLLVLKAVVGAVTLVMLARFAGSGFRLESEWVGLEDFLFQISEHPQLQSPFATDLLQQLGHNLRAGFAMMGHLSLLLLPLMMVSEIYIKALSLRLFLPLLTHTPKSELDMKRLVVLLAYPKWLGLFGVIPYTGWIVSAVIFIFTLNALRWTFQTPLLKSFFAYIFLDLLINLGVVALALGAVALALAAA